LKKLERSIRSLGDCLNRLSSDNDVAEFLRIIHRPGWTTPAEFKLVTGIVESMIAQARALTQLKGALMTGSRAVTTE
jgi:hypothetical protein